MMKLSEKYAIAALDDLLNWLRQGGRVAIYDATNSTRERRDMIMQRCVKEDVQVVFIESVCHDPAVIERNIRDTKVTSPEYTMITASTDIQLHGDGSRASYRRFQKKNFAV